MSILRHLNDLFLMFWWHFLYRLLTTEKKRRKKRAEWKWGEGVETLIFKQTRLVLISAAKYPIGCSCPGLRSWAFGQESHPPIWTGACSWPWGWQRSAVSHLWGLFWLRVDLGMFIARSLPCPWEIWHKTKGIPSPSLVCLALICYLPPPHIPSYPR